VVSSVLAGGLGAGICFLANPRLIAVALMHLLRLIPDLLQYVIAEMGAEFHPQFLGTAHCPVHCRDKGYVPQGPPVGNVLPAPHPPAQPPSWAPARTFGSIMTVPLVGRHKHWVDKGAGGCLPCEPPACAGLRTSERPAQQRVAEEKPPCAAEERRVAALPTIANHPRTSVVPTNQTFE